MKKKVDLNPSVGTKNNPRIIKKGEETPPIPAPLQKKKIYEPILEAPDHAMALSRDLEPPPTRNRRPGKVNLELVAELLAKGCTHNQIAKVCGCTRQAVGYLAKQHGLGEVEHFRAHRGALLSAKQSQLLDGLTLKKIENMGGRDITVSFGILFDKERLETGKSTQNMAHSFARLIEEACM